MVPILATDALAQHSVEQRCIRYWRPGINCVSSPGRRAHRRRLILCLRRQGSDAHDALPYSSLQPTTDSSVSSYTCVSHNHPDCQTLSGILSLAAREGWINTSITRHHRQFDFTNWQSLRRRYGHCVVTFTMSSVPIRAPLKFLLYAIRAYSGTISFEGPLETDDVRRKRIVHLLRKATYGKRPFSKRALILAHPKDLLWMYCSARHLMPADKDTLRHKIHGILRKFHRFPPLRSLVFRIPFNHYNRKHIRTHIHHLVHQTILPRWMKLYALRRMRIVFTKRKSVADIMNNLIPSSKAYTPEPPACVCKRICRVLRCGDSPPNTLKPPLRGHCSIRACDLPRHLAPLRECTKNVPIPDTMDANYEMTTAFTRFYRTLCELHVPDRRKGEHDLAGISSPHAYKVEFHHRSLTHSIILHEQSFSSISHRRYNILKAMFFASKRAFPHLFNSLEALSFHVELVRLALRYRSTPRYSTPTSTLTALRKCFGITCHLFSSPLTAHADLQYCTRYPRDQLFGACYGAFLHRWRGVSIAEPVFHKRYINRTFAFAIHSAQTTHTPVCTIAIVPKWHATTHLSRVLTHPSVHNVATFPTFRFSHKRRVRESTTPVMILAICNPAYLESHPIDISSWHTLEESLRATHEHLYMAPRPPLSSHPSPHFRPYQWRKTRHVDFSTPPIWRAPAARPPTRTHTARHTRQTSVNLSNALNACFARPTDDTISCELSPIHPHPQSTIIPPARTFLALRQRLGHAIVGYQDKNAGQCTIECPVIQWRREKRMYYDDPSHFEHCDMDPHGYYQLMHDTHARLEWGRFQSFPSERDCSIPYGYAFQKAKDPNKDRPIVSYWVHPCKKVLNFGSRALTFILKHANLKAFTLWNVHDMTSTLRQWQADLKPFGAHTRFLNYCADVKEMYTGLPHNCILRAVEFVLERCATTHRRGRRRCVSIERRKRGSIRFGRSDPSLMSQFVTLTFADIKAICETDINTCYFTSLGTLLRQIVGVPMGSPGSPAFAICICMYYEHQFHASIYDLTRFTNIEKPHQLFRFMRYVDDVFGVVCWDSRDPSTLTFAKHIIRMLMNHTYHPNMLLKEEPSSGWFPFLEALINFPATGDMRVQFHVKNYAPILANGNPKLYTIQHHSSFMNRTQAINKVYGAIHRLRRTVLEPSLIVSNSLELCVVYHQQGYSAGIMASSFDKMAKRFPQEPLWAHIPNLIHNLFAD